jgi:hypothetical protein
VKRGGAYELQIKKLQDDMNRTTRETGTAQAKMAESNRERDALKSQVTEKSLQCENLRA